MEVEQLRRDKIRAFKLKRNTTAGGRSISTSVDLHGNSDSSHSPESIGAREINMSK